MIYTQSKIDDSNSKAILSLRFSKIELQNYREWENESEREREKESSMEILSKPILINMDTVKAVWSVVGMLLLIDFVECI